MWGSRVDDKVRAEGIADNDYHRLFIERGTVLHATRDCKPLEFREVLDKHLVSKDVERISPDPRVGGLGKFIRDNITYKKKSKIRSRRELYTKSEEKKLSRVKKGGAGWLHLSMNC